MLDQRQSAQVRYTLLELLYRGREEELEQTHPQVLALLSYHHIGFEAGLRCLRNLGNSRFRLWGWAEDEVRYNCKDCDLIQLTGMDNWLFGSQDTSSITKRFRHFFIPVLSFSLVSDIVRFNDRRPFVSVILKALLQGEQVTALKVGADPYHVLWRKEGYYRGTPSIKQELYTQLQQLRRYGVQLVDENDVHTVIGRTLQSKRSLLTQQDIAYAHERGESVIRAERSTIVTPLAVEVANEYGIRITFDEY